MPEKQQRRVTSYTRKDGTKVRSYTQSANRARARAAWVAAGFSTLTAGAVVWEMGVTAVSVVALVLTAVLGTVAVAAGRQVEKNRKTMGQQQQRRRATSRTSRTRRTSSSTRRRTSSSRRR